ncbi:hypothetical protein GOP47_0020068 [Adiantum capillus-veneris]|uniref:Peroxidase n=1 Tax=Adiantum capillus-veneris TaxID=13818 RepID=A0A9D4UD86_ADICA|nr:hypothetical protein GOP47_0020068 [Adiantum capillus-veneris]
MASRWQNKLQPVMASFILMMMVASMRGDVGVQAQLVADFYDSSCPRVQSLVRSGMRAAVQNETRMAASILRLFFHDCFVQGCDASILLDDTATMQGEKSSFPNANSLRGFEVVDTIKANVESVCPGVVSCADILALAARDAIVLAGGPTWKVLLGRRDSTTASYSLANSNLPSPSEDLSSLISKFQAQGLSTLDLVTLSGAHTIGQARCVNFKDRLYDEDVNNEADPTLDTKYLSQLQSLCPSEGGDDNLSSLDVQTPTRFDVCYYSNLLKNKGLLTSDQELASDNSSTTFSYVQSYTQTPSSFLANFSISMIAMGNIGPLIGTLGQIRTNCHVIN